LSDQEKEEIIQYILEHEKEPEEEVTGHLAEKYNCSHTNIHVVFTDYIMKGGRG